MPNPTPIPSPQEVVALAAALGARLPECIAEGERLRRLPEQTLAAFIDAGLHKAMQPRRYGGWGVGWETHVASAFELGKGDGSQGWALTSFADQTQLVGMFAPQAQDEVWSGDPGALIAGARAPTGTLVPHDGGYRVSGRWRGCAGIDYASWLLASGIVEEDGQRRRAHFLVPKSAATVTDDWFTAGLAGAGAKTFTLQEAVVPRHWVLEEKDYQEGTGPGVRVNPEIAYKFPRDGALFALAAVPLGVAVTMLESFITLACDTVKRGKRVENNFSTSLRIGESRAEIDAGRLALIDAARTSTATLECGKALTAECRALNSLKSAHAVALAARAADRLFAAGGAKVNLRSNPLQRYLQDIHALAAQEAFNWAKRCSRYGRLRLGESI